MIARAITFVLILLISLALLSVTRGVWFTALVGLVCLSALAAPILKGAFPRFSFYAARLFAGACFIVGLWLLWRRWSFIEANGGIEGPGGLGSPAAFVLGMGFEQMLFTVFPLLIFLSTSRGTFCRGRHA